MEARWHSEVGKPDEWTPAMEQAMRDLQRAMALTGEKFATLGKKPKQKTEQPTPTKGEIMDLALITEEQLTKDEEVLSRTPELQAAYDALGQQKKIIDVAKMIHDGGYGRKSYKGWDYSVPRIALARAHWGHSFLTNRNPRFSSSGRRHADRIKLEMPSIHFEMRTNNFFSVKARVPVVPKEIDFRRDDLIAYEAEWVGDKVKAPRPADPAILRPLQGRIYEVVAVWDLTELEQAILAERL